MLFRFWPVFWSWLTWVHGSKRKSRLFALLVLQCWSAGSLECVLCQTSASNATKPGSTLSCETFEIYDIDVFLVNRVRWYWEDRPDCPSVKFSKSTASEPLSGKVVPKVTGCLMSSVISKPSSFTIELERWISPGLGFTWRSLPILRHKSICWRHWSLIQYGWLEAVYS